MRFASGGLAFLFLLIGCTLGATGAEAPAPLPVIEFRLRHGDDPRWAAANWDDRDWEVVARDDRGSHGAVDFMPARAGVFWLRYQVERLTQPAWGRFGPAYFWPTDKPGAPINCIFLASVFCYEFFWDGRLIGQSGKVGSSYGEEIPGPLDNVMLIPDSLLGPGPHVIAIRMSTYHHNFPSAKFRMFPTLGNYAARLNYEARQPIVPSIGAGAGLLVAAICAVLYVAFDRRRTLVICALLALAVAVFFTLLAWRWLHHDPFTWLYPRYLAMLWTMGIIGLLMIWLLVEQLTLARKAWWLQGAVAIIVIAAQGEAYHQVRTVWLGRAMLIYALVVAAWAVWRRRPGARLALAGVLIGLGSVQQASDLRTIISPTFFLFFGMLVMILLGALGWQIRADRRRTCAAQLAAARLETELLKKTCSRISC